MTVEAHVTIHGSKAAIWDVITNIEHASETINGIERVEILERPESGLVGLRWRETRRLFGKTATEEMWITAAAENDFYTTRAESHGCIYTSTLSITDNSGSSSLKMTHDSKPQGFIARLLSAPMGIVFKGAMRKVILRDLNDIRAAVEQA